MILILFPINYGELGVLECVDLENIVLITWLIVAILQVR